MGWCCFPFKRAKKQVKHDGGGVIWQLQPRPRPAAAEPTHSSLNPTFSASAPELSPTSPAVESPPPANETPDPQGFTILGLGPFNSPIIQQFPTISHSHFRGGFFHRHNSVDDASTFAASSGDLSSIPSSSRPQSMKPSSLKSRPPSSGPAPGPPSAASSRRPLSRVWQPYQYRSIVIPDLPSQFNQLYPEISNPITPTANSASSDHANENSQGIPPTVLPSEPSTPRILEESSSSIPEPGPSINPAVPNLAIESTALDDQGEAPPSVDIPDTGPDDGSWEDIAEDERESPRVPRGKARQGYYYTSTGKIKRIPQAHTKKRKRKGSEI